MLKELFANQLTLGCAQAAVATLLALAVMLLARQRNIHLERETVVALIRGIVQITAVGSILVLLLRGPAWTSVFLLDRNDSCCCRNVRGQVQGHAKKLSSFALCYWRGCRFGYRSDDRGGRYRHAHHVAGADWKHAHRQRHEY